MLGSCWALKVSDIASCLTSSKEKYYALNGINYTDCDLLLSDESQLYRICSSWKGRDFLDTYDRAINFISICPDPVRSEYTNYIANPANNIDLLNIKWGTFETISRIIWKTAFTKTQMNKTLGLSTVNALQLNKHRPPPFKPPNQPNPTALQTVPPDDNPFQDITLHCKICNTDFIWNIGQQEHHSQMGFKHQPQRCKQCKMEQANANPVADAERQCYQFQSGQCSYGDSCRYSHDQPKVVNLTVIIKTPNKETESDDEGFEIDRPSSAIGVRFNT